MDNMSSKSILIDSLNDTIIFILLLINDIIMNNSLKPYLAIGCQSISINYQPNSILINLKASIQLDLHQPHPKLELLNS